MSFQIKSCVITNVEISLRFFNLYTYSEEIIYFKDEIKKRKDLYLKDKMDITQK